jgi:hypothetical protein
LHHHRGFDIILGFSTRHRTVHFRSSSRTTPDALNGAPFASTLTTTAFDRSSLRWFEARSCKAGSEGPTLIFGKAPLLLDRLLLSCARERVRSTPTPNPSIERTATGLAHSTPHSPIRGPSRWRSAHVKR